MTNWISRTLDRLRSRAEGSRPQLDVSILTDEELAVLDAILERIDARERTYAREELLEAAEGAEGEIVRRAWRRGTGELPARGPSRGG